MSHVWESRIKEILADPEKAKRAALLFFLVDQHVTSSCFHKRQCTEQLYLQEVETLIK